MNQNRDNALVFPNDADEQAGNALGLRELNRCCWLPDPYPPKSRWHFDSLGQLTGTIND